jgi:hypothetical protein
VRHIARRPSLQPPPARCLDHGVEPGEERRRVGIVQRRATTDREQTHLDHFQQPAAHRRTGPTTSLSMALSSSPSDHTLRPRDAADLRDERLANL